MGVCGWWSSRGAPGAPVAGESSVMVEELGVGAPGRVFVKEDIRGTERWVCARGRQSVAACDDVEARAGRWRDEEAEYISRVRFGRAGSFGGASLNMKTYFLLLNPNICLSHDAVSVRMSC